MTGILMMAVGNSYGSAPVNTVAPAVTGTAQVRQTLSCSTGTWTGAPTPTFTYQWQSNSSNISGATSSTYQIVDAYVGTVIRCVVTATNSVAPGGVSANSNATSSVTANVPAAPTIGTATAASATTASVTFTAPSGPLATGGSAITGYTVYSSGGQSASGASSPITVTGLSPETSYNFYVRANNAVGQSANSGTSNTITTPASYFIALSDYVYSTIGAGPVRAVGSNFIAAYSGPAAYGGIPALGVNTSTGAASYGVMTGTGNTIYPWTFLPNRPSGYGNYENPASGFIDTSGNAYGGGSRYGSGNSPALFAKTNSGGSKQWGIQIGTTEFGSVNSVQYDQQGYIMVVGAYNGAGFITRVSEGGSVVFSKTTGSSMTVTGADSDSSGYIITSEFFYNANQPYSVIRKVDTSGTSQWNREYRMNGTTSSSNNVSFRGLEVVGSDIYVSGWAVDSGTQGGVLLKINGSDGSIAWQKRVTNASMIGVTYESDGYLYWVGSGAGAVVIKTDTSGNTSWIRNFSISGYGVNGCRVNVSGSTLYVAGTYSPSNMAPFYLKVPTDGSKTGTYTVGSYSCTWGSNAVSVSSESSLTSSVFGGNISTTLATSSDTYATCGTTSQTTTVTQI